MRWPPAPPILRPDLHERHDRTTQGCADAAPGVYSATARIRLLHDIFPQDDDLFWSPRTGRGPAAS